MAKIKSKIVSKTKGKMQVKSKSRQIKRKTPKATAVPKKYMKKACSLIPTDKFMKQDVEASNSDTDSDKFSESELLSPDDEEVVSNDEVEESDDENITRDVEDNDEEEQHKKSLVKLQKTDPEFYKFLQENDKKLLQFNLSDDSDKDEAADEDDEIHKPVTDLEVASDESDFEKDDEVDGGLVKDDKVITLKMLKTWQTQIQTDKSNKTIVMLMEAFHAALLRVSSEEEGEPAYYKVEGSSIFNGVVQLCVLELGPAIRRFLGLSQGSKQLPHKCKKFVKVKRALKLYFSDLLKLMSGVTSSNIQTVLLKHLHYMSSLLISYPNVTKSIIKRLITIWGTGDESVRVVAFFCILRITNNQQASLLETVLKSMYMTYVKNSKFVSLNSLPSINFMRRSLVEMFTLDINAAYQHVFLYIRQLAIHLRNAITVNKKENIQAVYNWQFVNSLRLWGNLLAVTCNKPQLQQLMYPFVQVCLGTLKLVPTTQYYPLRFHVVQILMDLSKDAGIFIPILPFLLEVLTMYDFNKKHQKVSMKPLHFTCILRLSKSQLMENGFKDTVIETIYGQLLEYLSSQSHTIAFPDLSLVAILQIKLFLKKCKNVNYNRKMKQILEKIEQTNQFIENERKKVTFNLTDFKHIDGWENQIRNQGTPLATYYENWNKLSNVKKNKLLTNNEELGDYKLPTIKKVKKITKKDDGPIELFPSDSEDNEIECEKKNHDGRRKRGKRGGKNVNKKFKPDNSGPVVDNGEKDIVEDLELSNW